MLKKFYDKLHELEVQEQIEGEDAISSLIEMFNQSILHFKENIESYLSSEDEDLSSKYEIIIPYVLRGLLIHLINPNLDREDYQTELMYIIQYLEIFQNSFKDVSLYLERYLAQISK